jgi:HD-GYP domain-containing protein (c-di-GMP phosphodiesterase class II)
MKNKKFVPIFRDMHGNILCKTNLKLTQQIIKDLVKEKSFDGKIKPVSSTPIAKDLEKLINQGVYKQIFSNKKETKKIVSIINKTKLAGALIKEILIIKKHLPETYQHILTVCALSVKICIDLKSDLFDPFKIAEMGLVHDIGKSRLPAEVLEKVTPLTEEEFRIIQEHPLIEYLLISHYTSDPKSYTALASFSHHERLDGSGYPRGLKKLDKYIQTIIPCDIFDALISQRPYRNEPFTVRAALDLLLAEAKKGRISEKFVKCLISYVRKDKPHYKKVKIAKPDRDPPPKINFYGIRQKKP